MSNANTPEWTFREVPPGIKNRNPVQDEFFNSSEALTEISSLIRESIQNSLDAHQPGSVQPVLLKFTLATASKSTCAKYFKGLQNHIDFGIPGSKFSLGHENCDYLIIEDFNTTGLLGDSNKDQLSEKDIPSENSYHYFVWAEGSSAKTEGNRGRWGIGKIVFPRLSNIKTFFVLSKRESTSAPCGKGEILIGMSTLRGHTLNGKNFQPDGWWAHHESAQSVPVPVKAEQVNDFKKDWQIKRDAELGLTILVPYIPSFISKELIRDCIIRDYFIAIVQGLLEVEVSDNSNLFRLTKDNLRTECENLGEDDRVVNSKTKEEMLCLIDMLIDSKSNRSVEALELEVSDEFPNKWNSLVLASEQADIASNLLDRGQTVLCRVKCLVPFKHDKNTKDVFDVYIKRASDTRASAVFSREGIVIPSANSALIRDHLVLVLVDSGPLANLLADAEGPAHEKWSEKTDKFRMNYPVGKGGQLLTFIRKSPSELLFKIKGSGSDRDSTTFANFFPLPGIQNLGTDGKTQKKKGDGENSLKPVVIEIPRSLQIFFVDESPNGFSIKSTSDNPTLIGKRIYIKVAYKVRNGDAFSKWQEIDFDLSLKKPRLDGCLVRAVRGNQVILEITGRKFKAIWGGFDPIRDLDIKADLTELDSI